VLIKGFVFIMNEIFKDIPGYEGIYQVSNLGNVKSLKTQKEKILKSCKSDKSHGYKLVVLRKDSKSKTYTVHQLVAMVFLNHKPCRYKFVINHKDFNRTNNNVNNLEVITMRENSNKKHLKSTSKYTGVSFCKKSKKWISQIYYNNKHIYLGAFNTEKEASIYYKNAIVSIKHGFQIKTKKTDFTSKYKGIDYDKTTGKWRCRILIDKKLKYLGRFLTEQEAYLAYKNELNQKKQ
jgi:hypothetical protein